MASVDGNYGQTGFHFMSQRPVSASRHTSPELPLEEEASGLEKQAGKAGGYSSAHASNGTSGSLNGGKGAPIPLSTSFFSSPKPSGGSLYQPHLPHLPHLGQSQVQQHHLAMQQQRHPQHGYLSPHLAAPVSAMQHGISSGSPLASQFIDPALSAVPAAHNGRTLQGVDESHIGEDGEEDEEDNDEEEEDDDDPVDRRELDEDDDDDDDDENSSEYSAPHHTKKRRRGRQQGSSSHAAKLGLNNNKNIKVSPAGSSLNGSRTIGRQATKKAKIASISASTLLDADGRPKSTRGSKACTVCRRLKMRCESTGSETDTKCKRCKSGGHDVGDLD